jgi:cytochrome c
MKLFKFMLPILSTSMLMAASGESIYQAKCASCHGKNAEKKALGHSNVIKGMPVDQFITLTKAFATGEQKAMPIAKIVKKQFIDTYSDAEIKEVAKYVNELQ